MSKWFLAAPLFAFAACGSSSTVTSEIVPDGGSVNSTADGAVVVGEPDGGAVADDGGIVVGEGDGGVVVVPDAPVGNLPDAPVVQPPGQTDFGTAAGLTEPIFDVSTDEAGNVWAISRGTLYLLTPGAASFVGFGNANGLHVEPFVDPTGTPQVTFLTAVAGGTPNRVYLGYFGYEGSADPFNDTDQQKQLGNGDRIDYDPATGQIAVHRYGFQCNGAGEPPACWEDRSVRRIVAVHTGVAAGRAFFGFNHGTAHVFGDAYGDHVHPQIEWPGANGKPEPHQGECHALAVNDDGTVWIGDRHAFGLFNWNPDPIAWVSAKFRFAYTQFTPDHSLFTPVGYVENDQAISVAPDGTIWIASDFGLTSWNPATRITTLRQWNASTGFNIGALVDVVADLDGTLWLVTASRSLLHFDPATGTLTATPINDARRLYLDKLVTPRALYVARVSGVSVIR